VCGITAEFTVTDEAAERVQPLQLLGCNTSGVVVPTSRTPLGVPACVAEWDVVVESQFAHWVGVGGLGHLTSCLEQRGESAHAAFERARRELLDLYTRQLQLHARLAAAGARPGASILHLTAPIAEPGPAVDALLPPHAPRTPRFIEPAPHLHWLTRYTHANARYGHSLFAAFNQAAREALGSRGGGGTGRLSLLDLEVPMSYRVDGHPTGDMLHFCLPGPPDLLTQVLHSFIL